MANWDKNRGERDELDRGGNRPQRPGFRDEQQSGDREFFGREDYSRGRGNSMSGREWNNRSTQDDWNSNEQFTGQSRYGQSQGRTQDWDRDRFGPRESGRYNYDRPNASYDDYDRGRDDYETDMFASSSGAPYGSQSNQRPLGSYGDREDFGTGQSRPRTGGSPRFRSSTDLSSNYQGHYGQSRFGSVGDSSGFGTGSSIVGSSNIPSYGRTTSDRNIQTSDTSDYQRGFTGQSYRGVGPKGFQRSDERIREMVSETLEDHDAIDATEIEVTVSSGEVTLSGMVPNRHMKRLAEDVIEFLPGVKDVTNSLKVNKGLFGRMADSIQHALGTDENEEYSSSTSRSGSTGRSTSRSKR